ncbi:ATP-binding cassette domain-containing protein [Halopseudomonas laoshanensis]|uniref:ATP-binding cassette domain-containing protein n=1 Tax=Halopseudomonas laoshanensis TaxID=2268758 RepID=A0A7V7GMQ6_9GAMM|nr:ATP-binding cassette domain-containing protein [Halopseudomonas laoshanensis]KAA0690116.1 ATP-binding cassette domain-containing protein [Halopseudomonas laoshanensis]WOD10997.1 ATP-binding cassette domain-containing protein [Pseudomonas sp. NyZ704]
MNSVIIDLDAATYAWPGQPPLLDIKHLQLLAGERVFLKGPSGSGKTTLLGLLGGVYLPDQGQITLLGKNMASMSAAERDRFRADHTGYIFQMFNLLPYLSVVENVTLPCHFSRVRRERALKRHDGLASAALHLLHSLGLSDNALLDRSVNELSIGQQQRVAAARALIGSPELVIADEPTSALDADSREAFLRLLFAECSAAGSSLLFVSHDASLEPLFDRALSLRDINLAAQPQEVC